MGCAEEASGSELAKSLCFHAVAVLQWYPGGPELTYFPVPVADPLRPWGGPCEECAPMQCAGHYLKPDEHLDHFNHGNHGKTGMKFKPPSTVIAEKYRKAAKHGCHLSSEEIKALANEVLLTEDNVRMWIGHLEDVTARRKEGAKKAVQTRAKNKTFSKKEQTIIPSLAVDAADECQVYCTCGEYGTMIACDSPGCPIEWYHLDCIDIDEVPQGEWICSFCKV